MNIELFNHAILGEMHVFANEQGLWFNYNEVIDCLEIEEVRANKKYKFLSSNLKQNVDCQFENEHMINTHRFIHEKAVYQFMCLGTSKYCQEFQEWVADIAYEFDILNVRNLDMGVPYYAETESNYQLVKSYIENMNDSSPLGETVKNAMRKVDGSFRIGNIIDNKNFRTDYTINEALQDPYYDPDLSKEDIEDLRLINEGDPWSLDVIYAQVRQEMKKEGK